MLVKTVPANPVTTIRQVAPTTITGIVQSGPNLLLSVTGGLAGGSYTLLTSTNVALPLSSWTTNSTGNFDSFGNVTVTNAIDPATPQRFFTELQNLQEVANPPLRL